MARGVEHKINAVSTRHAELNGILQASLSDPNGQDYISLVDDDGIRQFILGVDSLDDPEVRIGFA